MRRRLGLTEEGTRRVILPVCEQDTPVVRFLLETVLEVDSASRVALALDRADVRDIAFAGRVCVVTLIREDGESLLRGLFDWLRCGTPTEEQHDALERLIPALAAAVRD